MVSRIDSGRFSRKWLYGLNVLNVSKWARKNVSLIQIEVELLPK
jgi:hypothetical protein